jgi:hypothetical protein
VNKPNIQFTSYVLLLLLPALAASTMYTSCPLHLILHSDKLLPTTKHSVHLLRPAGAAAAAAAVSPCSQHHLHHLLAAPYSVQRRG